MSHSIHLFATLVITPCHHTSHAITPPGTTNMPTQYPIISVNGQRDAAISSLDRGFVYGDGVFETCRLADGKILLWPYHLARLTRSCAQLKIQCDRELLLTYINHLLAVDGADKLADGIVKLIISRGIGGRGYAIPSAANTTYCVQIFPHTPMNSAAFQQGIAVCICALTLSAQASLAGLKHLNRLESIIARSEWAAEYGEGLLFDQQGYLIEATSSNIFLVRDGQLLTPELNTAGVLGVMRQHIIDSLAPQLKLRCVQKNLLLEDLLGADEIFICNAVNGIVPVIAIDQKGVVHKFNLGAITQKLQQQIWVY
jgi:4-amino-4-deoxychorismate lyase